MLKIFYTHQQRRRCDKTENNVDLVPRKPINTISFLSFKKEKFLNFQLFVVYELLSI
jgi:hypothetical protein